MQPCAAGGRAAQQSLPPDAAPATAPLGASSSALPHAPRLSRLREPSTLPGAPAAAGSPPASPKSPAASGNAQQLVRSACGAAPAAPAAAAAAPAPAPPAAPPPPAAAPAAAGAAAAAPAAAVKTASQLSAGAKPGAPAAAAGTPAAAAGAAVPPAAKRGALPLHAPATGAAAAASGAAHAAAPAACKDADDDDSSSEAGSSEDGALFPWVDKPAWYRRPRSLCALLLLLVSGGLVLAGLLLQLEPGLLGGRSGSGSSSSSSSSASAAHVAPGAVFPWLYFFAAAAPLALAWRWTCWRLYTAAESTGVVREELYFLRPLRSKLAALMLWLTMLLWFKVCFAWLWCTEGCDSPGYRKALLVLWRLLACVTLFAAANTLKCGLARLLAFSFYRTAHFAKVKEAIERELYLIRLSQARSSLLPPPPPLPLGALGDDGAGGPPAGRSAWGSTMWRRTSQIFMGRPVGPSPVQEQEEDDAGTPAAAGHQHGGSAKAAHAPDGSAHGGHAGAEGVLVTVALRGSPAAAAAGQPSSDDGLLLSPKHQGSGPAAGAGHHKSFGLGWQLPTPCDVARHAQPPQHAPPAAQPPKRQQSYELFAAERVPSILSLAQAQQPSRSSRTGSRPGSKAGARLGRGARPGSRFSSSSRVSLVLSDLVPGVDGLLLQPEVLGAAGKGSINGQAPRAAGRMTEDELNRALCVNTFGVFVDRYYGMSAAAEAAHVRQVKRFAKGLFANVLGDAERSHLLPHDFSLFFNDEHDAAAAFEYFDRNGDGTISCSELQESAAEMLCERKNIAASIKDTDSVVNSLETGLGLLVHFVTCAFYALVWGVNIVQGFTTFSATALALTFVFGDAVKGVFESALYLFVEHPYDVGDALMMPGNMLARVKKFDLQFTVLLQSDGQLVWHPNQRLRTQPLVNLSRSAPRWEGYTCLVDMDTPDEVRDTLAAALAAHVASQPSHFKGAPTVMWRGLEDPLKLRLAVGVTYSFSGEDVRRYVTARNGILAVIRRELAAAGVTYTVPLQPQALDAAACGALGGGAAATAAIAALAAASGQADQA